MHALNKIETHEMQFVESSAPDNKKAQDITKSELHIA